MRLGASLFVTGTDTGVGKTTVTAALAACLARAGVDVRALKPVASGTPAGQPPEDALLLGTAAGHAPAFAFSFAAPLSPHRAAALESGNVSPETLLAWIQEQRGAVTLAEGAGGWEVPYAPGFRVADLAGALGWPVLVVAANRLGVLNHTLLTVEAIRRRQLPLAGVVLVDAETPDLASATNLQDLRDLLPGVSVRAFPRIDPADPGQLCVAGRELISGGGR